MKTFVLADCNNFYASCERIFNPYLENKPVIVLSNNDGCIVARSQEAKSLGIGMGEPYFKVKDLCTYHKVNVFSSNYQLYGNISQRVMSVLNTFTPTLEYYSIDEAFLEFETSSDLFSKCISIKKRIRKWIGIPISLGIAPTKTLAKIANSLAKKDQSGVYDLSDPDKRVEVLKNYPVEDIWGIGSRLKKRLFALGIYTAWDFCQSDPTLIRQKMGVIGERMVFELRGIRCLPIEHEISPKKSITCSRSFGKVLTELLEIQEALSSYVNTASAKLRAQNSAAGSMCIFLEQLINSTTGERYSQSAIVTFKIPTNFTPYLIAEAKKCMEKLFNKNCRYKKCGVILLDLVPEQKLIPDFFTPSTSPKNALLMHTIDAINTKHGKNKVFYGAMGVDKSWITKCERATSHYTTNWDELATVKAV